MYYNRNELNSIWTKVEWRRIWLDSSVFHNDNFAIHYERLFAIYNNNVVRSLQLKNVVLTLKAAKKATLIGNYKLSTKFSQCACAHIVCQMYTLLHTKHYLKCFRAKRVYIAIYSLDANRAYLLNYIDAIIFGDQNMVHRWH